MVSFDRASLAAAAGIDPWALQAKLGKGDPAQIEALAAAFFRASGRSGAAETAARKSQAYVRQGYSVQGSSPIDMSAAAKTLVRDPAVGKAHTAQIAKILGHVGGDLGRAGTRAGHEIDQLDAAVNRFVASAQTTARTTMHMAPEDRESVLQGIFDDAVAVVRSHGATVKGLITTYERTLHQALRSMADLGYIPPDAVDEGPGDVDLDTGTQDGKTTVAAAKSGDRARLRRAMFKIRLIDDAIKHRGGHVDDSQYAFLYEYYDQTAKHSDTIWNAAKHDAATRNAIARPYADGMLNLTRGAEQTDDEGHPPHYRNDHGPGTYGRGGVNGLPQSVQDVLRSRIGKVQPTPQYAGGGDHPTPDMRRAEWQDGHWVVDNYANDSAFASLLNNASKGVQGGDDFSKTLAETALRWKHDENAVQTNTANWLQAAHTYYNYPGVDSSDSDARALGFPPDTDPKHLHLGMTDDGASAALATASRNSYASANVLNDAGDRHAVLGLNWHNGDGASKLIVSGTAPDPTNQMLDPQHPGQSVRNEAALNVMQDVGSDYRTLAHNANGAVKGALTTVAIDHLASFASPSLRPSAGGDEVGTLTIPGGRDIHGVQLSNDTSGNFLKAIATFGPRQYGLLHAAALEQGAQWIHQAPPGSTDATNTGAAYASNLDGRITGAGFAAASEIAGQDAKHDHDTYAAELVKQQNEATHDMMGKVAFQTIDAGLDIASFGASDRIGKALDALSTINGLASTGYDDYGEFNSSDANSEYIQHLQSQVHTSLQQAQNSAHVSDATRVDQDWMAVRAAALNPDHAMQVSHGGRVDVSNLVDANGRPYLPAGQLVTSNGAVANPAIDVNDPHYQYATSDATYHKVIAPLQDHVYGAYGDGWAAEGINSTVQSADGAHVKWEQKPDVLNGDNATYSWSPGRDPNTWEFFTPERIK
ncbi:hypothetical protein SAMN05443575_1435 [Jatrophihabitans endophyticus]|uniref:Uncharacterized protein n=1 Tax=Jatrophihabitans endophyticus TaxID=1206085 RepID=A0A1M5H8Q7_9ACTN|nr:hypothetical protein [Jatrophihabitans endophyticus]SHG12367.1 hypothetical protein SAMN05443575_1435 [Jatrophihabitans endophyticus]